MTNEYFIPPPRRWSLNSIVLLILELPKLTYKQDWNQCLIFSNVRTTEQIAGFEPALFGWKPKALPLCNTCFTFRIRLYTYQKRKLNVINLMLFYLNAFRFRVIYMCNISIEFILTYVYFTRFKILFNKTYKRYLNFLKWY